MIATPDELTRILGQSPPWMRCFLLLCCQLGLRFNEAARIRLIDWTPSTSTLSARTKGNKVRLLPTTPELDELLTVAARRDAPPDTSVLWLLLGKPASHGPHIGTLEREPREFIRKEWQRMKRRLNINPNLTIHDLRRTRITEVYRQTLDVKLAQQFAGHESVASTALYLAPWDETRVLEAIRRTAPPGGWKGTN